MKKIVVLLLMTVMLTGCNDTEAIQTYEPTVNPTLKKFELVEDGETGILYIDNEIKLVGRIAYKYHIYTPYYSENGKLCKYYDGKIVEVGE